MHKNEVLKKLQYRKTVVDCFNTWRSAYIGGIFVISSILTFTILLIKTFSLIESFAWTLFFYVYLMIAVYSYDMILHSIKIIKTFRLKQNIEYSRLNSLKLNFKESVQKLNLDFNFRF